MRFAVTRIENALNVFVSECELHSKFYVAVDVACRRTLNPLWACLLRKSTQCIAEKRKTTNEWTNEKKNDGNKNKINWKYDVVVWRRRLRRKRLQRQMMMKRNRESSVRRPFIHLTVFSSKENFQMIERTVSVFAIRFYEDRSISLKYVGLHHIEFLGNWVNKWILRPTTITIQVITR